MILEDLCNEPVSLAFFKGFLKITHDVEDSFLELCLRAARENLEKRLSLSLTSKKVQFSFRPHQMHNKGLALERYPYQVTPGRMFITVPMAPVKEIVKVTLEDYAGTKTELDLAKTSLHPQKSIVVLQTPWQREIEIVYKAGYENVPADLKMVLLKMAAGFYETQVYDGSFLKCYNVRSL